MNNKSTTPLPSPQRIFCIGRNYAAHISEMGAPPNDQCIVFMKPVSCLVTGEEVTLPRGVGSVHHEAEMVVALGRGGKNIPRCDALSHVSAVTLGLDLTLRDLQAKIKEKGHPWEKAKAFDHSAPIGEFKSYDGNSDLAAIEFTCTVNGEVRQEGTTADMLFPVDRLIEILSGWWELLPGDLIYTGTPSGVGPVEPGDVVVLESPQLGRFQWRMR
jgi:acylpyruvate hydrolase